MSVKMKLDYDKRLDKTTLDNLERVVEKRLKNEYDFVVVIVGNVGDGKSSLGMLSCGYIGEKTGEPFTDEHVLFSGMDYRIIERKLRPMHALQFDEGEEVFFSRGTMGRQQKKMVLKFAQIRQKRHYIVICTPSLFLLEKWFRGGGGETRINAVWRVIRRGMFYSYSNKTGSMKKIKFNKDINEVIYPECDYVGFWHPIPKEDKFFKAYIDRKNRFLTANRESSKIVREREKVGKLMSDSLTVNDIMEIHQVSKHAIYNWFKLGIFGKNGLFVGMDGAKRVKYKAYQVGMKKLARLKQKQNWVESLKKARRTWKKMRQDGAVRRNPGQNTPTTPKKNPIKPLGGVGRSSYRQKRHTISNYPKPKIKKHIDRGGI